MCIQHMYMVQPIVSTGFRGQHRDASAGVRDIPLLSQARDYEDQGSPRPEDGDFFMPGQMLQKQRMPSTSLLVALIARSKQV